ncbi:MAG: tetratricopeptide repeat protein [Thermodesulfovibrionales bacterium]
MKPLVLCLQNISGKKYPLFLFFFALALSGFSPKTCLADSRSIFTENKSSVVVIYTYDKDGSQIHQASGFIAGTDGVVVTNYHVISDAAGIKVKFENTMLDVKGLLYIDRGNDIAMLKTGGNNLPAVRIRDADTGPAGQKIYLIGSPGGEEKIIFDGTLSRIKHITPEKKLLLITAPVTKGCSGSPVFNENGEVIGIATFLMDKAQPFYFAMPVSGIKKRLSLNKFTPLDKAALVVPENTAEHWFNLAAAYESLSLFSDASGAYQNAIRIKPEDAIAHNRLGTVYANLEIYSFAISEHSEAINLKPDYQEAYYNLAIDYLNSDKIQLAAETFEEAIRLKPDDAKSYSNLSVAFFKSDKLKEASEAAKQAILLNPDYAGAYYNLGAVYSQMNMYSEAAEALKQFIRLKPEVPEGHLRLGIIYSMQETASALKEYEILKNLDPDSAEVLHKIIQAKNNDSETAVSSADAAEEKIPRQEPAVNLPPKALSAVVSAPPQQKGAPSQTTVLADEPDSSDKIDSFEVNPRPEAPRKIGKTSKKKEIYSVQLSIFSKKKNALSLSKHLKEKGYSVFIKTENRNKQAARYRVLVGSFSDKAEALKTSRVIFKKEKLKSVIYKH